MSLDRRSDKMIAERKERTTNRGKGAIEMALQRIASPWVAWFISDRQRTWQHAIRSEEFAEGFANRWGISPDSAISAFYSVAMKVEVCR